MWFDWKVDINSKACLLNIWIYNFVNFTCSKQQVQKQKKVTKVDFPEKFLFSLKCTNPYLEKFWCAFLGQNALIQSDCKTLWSSVSLEVILQFLWFFSWRYPPWKGSMWNYYFLFGVSRHSQLHPSLSILANSPFL